MFFNTLTIDVIRCTTLRGLDGCGVLTEPKGRNINGGWGWEGDMVQTIKSLL